MGQIGAARSYLWLLLLFPLFRRSGVLFPQPSFASFQVPSQLADRVSVDNASRTLSVSGKLTREELRLLTANVNRDQEWALNQLAFSSSWVDSVLKPRVISPVKKLRSWAFVLCVLCIGLSTRFAELATFGMKPFWAFTLGVMVNVPLGFFLSTVVFVDFWSKI